jgi:hypothetical protein
LLCDKPIVQVVKIELVAEITAISCLIFQAVSAFREPHRNPTSPRPDGDPHRHPTDETTLCGTLVMRVKGTEIPANQHLCA